MMAVPGDFTLQTPQHPTGIAFRPEEYRTVITIDAVHLEPLFSEENRDFGTDETAGAGH